MISTGGTMVSAIEALLERRCNPEVIIAATHAVLAGDALIRLASYPVRNMVFSDTLPQVKGAEMNLQVVSIAGMAAGAIKRLSAVPS